MAQKCCGEELPHAQGKEQQLRGRRRAERSYSTFQVRRGDLIQGKEQWLCFPGAAVKRYPMSKVRETQVRGHQRADTLKPYSQKTSQSNHTRTTALSNSMKLSHACGATQEGWATVERSDRMRSTGEGNGKPLQYSCLEIS